MDGEEDFHFPAGKLNARSLLMPFIQQSIDSHSPIWISSDPKACLARAQLLMQPMKAFVKHVRVCEGVLSKAQCSTVCTLEPGTHNYVLACCVRAGCGKMKRIPLPRIFDFLITLEPIRILFAQPNISKHSKTFQNILNIARFAKRAKHYRASLQCAIMRGAMCCRFLHHSKIL